jgi:hypothetical protein
MVQVFNSGAVYMESKSNTRYSTYLISQDLQNVIKHLILVMIDGVILVVDGILTVILSVKEFSVEVWKNNVIRRSIVDLIDQVDVIFCRFQEYLEKLKSILQYKILYEKLTKPMKDYYRKLKKNEIE